jgi:hypothetical protein
MRIRASSFSIAAILFACLCSLGGNCRGSEPTSSAPQLRTPPAVDFEAALDRAGHVTFRSWNGKAFRKDSDTELVFFADRTVRMLEYGIAGVLYRGTFEVDPDGRVSARFAHFPADWPEMLLDRDARSLLLRPTRGDGFVMGGRGGAFIGKDQGSYWPFRRLTGADEQEVLETLDEWTRGVDPMR